MNISKKDKAILRELAKQKLEYANESVQKGNAELWRKANDLKMTKPPVYINEIPWHEMNVADELMLRTQNAFCKELETALRRELYCCKHTPGNMVVSPHMKIKTVIHDSGFGIEEDADIVKTDESSNIVSRHFNVQIEGMEDISKIKDPVISVDEEKTKERLNAAREIFEGTLDVVQVGVKGYWFTPWDNLVRWTGVTQAMMDIMDRPEYISRLVERFVDASMVRLEQYESLGLWSSNNDNTRVGSGGYGYCSLLEPAEKHRLNAPLSQLWGCGNAQIFSSVSPDMHWEYSLKHELRWLERFGLSYYGCCEPLHNKMDLMDKIPNLRKVSISPWANLDAAAERTKGKYVMSCKPNPAIFLESNWDEGRAEKEILDILEKTKDCSIEIIMKDISTVNYKPQRLWKWSEIALRVIGEYFE